MKKMKWFLMAALLCGVMVLGSGCHSVNGAVGGVWNGSLYALDRFGGGVQQDFAGLSQAGPATRDTYWGRGQAGQQPQVIVVQQGPSPYMYSAQQPQYQTAPMQYAPAPVQYSPPPQPAPVVYYAQPQPVPQAPDPQPDPVVTVQTPTPVVGQIVIDNKASLPVVVSAKSSNGQMAPAFEVPAGGTRSIPGLKLGEKVEVTNAYYPPGNWRKLKPLCVGKTEVLLTKPVATVVTNLPDGPMTDQAPLNVR